MAKYTKHLRGDFTEFLGIVENELLRGSISATLEDGSDYEMSGIRCSVRVFERYSYWGRNRVSLNLTLFGRADDFRMTAITAGGSTAVFLKINTIGEEAFLDKLVKIVKDYRGTQTYE